MLALYTEEKLGAAYQIYARTHANKELAILDFESYRKLFETQYVAMSQPDTVFDGGENTH